MRVLARDDEEVAFWRRHTYFGVALCVVIPVIITMHSLLSPDRPHRVAVFVLTAATAVPAPLILLVPVDRLARHPYGRLFFDAWESVGILLVSAVVLLDGGADSAYVMFFYVLLAHAALTYPPVGTLIAGAGVVGCYIVIGLLSTSTSTGDVVLVASTLVLATGTCAIASLNHVRAYERTTAYARQIEIMAERDGLTGLVNHRAFHAALSEMARGARGVERIAVLLIDVDDFKSVNDTYGHPVGDDVLRGIGRVLEECSRDGDVPGRLGGDEFALLLPGATLDEGVAVGRRIRQTARERFELYGCTVSIGVDSCVTPVPASQVLACADRALYDAKRAGRDRVATANPTRARVERPAA
jgi:diguanylate cyclase (GGDEF)-like protein